LPFAEPSSPIKFINCHDRYHGDTAGYGHSHIEFGTVLPWLSLSSGFPTTIQNISMEGVSVIARLIDRRAWLGAGVRRQARRCAAELERAAIHADEAAVRVAVTLCD
jgi:hypothetical protein